MHNLDYFVIKLVEITIFDTLVFEVTVYSVTFICEVYFERKEVVNDGRFEQKTQASSYHHIFEYRGH